MIHILYPTGTFGSTIEYCIKRFSKDFSTDPVEVSPDGSLSNYFRECYIATSRDHYKLKDPSISISTVAYPNLDISKTATEVVTEFKNVIASTDQVIFMNMPELWQVERNRLFVYFKKNISTNFPLVMGDLSNIQQWGNYDSFTEMQRWELREYLSLENLGFQSTVDASQLCESSWLQLTPEEMLTDFIGTVHKVLNYLSLTAVNPEELTEFGKTWVHQQQYILALYDQIVTIVEKTVAGEVYEWHPLDIVSEALVQYLLRRQGIEIKCYGINDFPTSVVGLRSILE